MNTTTIFYVGIDVSSDSISIISSKYVISPVFIHIYQYHGEIQNIYSVCSYSNPENFTRF
jgi:hypothetical protein